MKKTCRMQECQISLYNIESYLSLNMSLKFILTNIASLILHHTKGQLPFHLCLRYPDVMVEVRVYNSYIKVGTHLKKKNIEALSVKTNMLNPE